MTQPSEHRYPCDQCGAQLRYAPGQTSLTCQHCGNVQALPEVAAKTRARALIEHDLKRGLRDDLPDAASFDVRTVHCTSCGALIELLGTSHATECPFCASPVVLDSDPQRLIKPQALVPFQLTEGQARNAMTDWLGNLWFAPNSLVEYARKGRALSGVYVPHWTFDASTYSRYVGQRGVHYYETRTVTVNVNGKSEQRQEQVRKTRWYPASGQVARDFDDVVVLGATSLPRVLAERLEPWDLGALQPYSPDYLAGFQAEGYTVSLADADRQAKEHMSQVIVGDVRQDIGGDDQRVNSVDTDWSAETFKHILLPVWMAAYKYNGKSYRFLVNGQTGEVQGERPWSVWKIAFAAILAAIVAAGLFYVHEKGGFR
ncbi:primosomal protein N' (replication factor Y) - superfamily II helicase [Xinfangfangia sp. CPCC 101601]|uniref:Primosomal protein N' (Replication factor Y) -superfamily II helicase n=1 Tax=Pseudogemmobacter lacusdianii TaxID=3069608 RepID=A0ABU0VSZ9_9RHOB|nr:primosomal protein N' (replication factor Y) - superfamily II helicase [Xinfangfangia sp. CPCC 101601]MDQ2064857.1 primosomal protein N' (replication factor Y) - superfamily II helicase [Xinfangfangia sp. CPCC 101601]